MRGGQASGEWGPCQYVHSLQEVITIPHNFNDKANDGDVDDRSNAWLCKLLVEELKRGGPPWFHWNWGIPAQIVSGFPGLWGKPASCSRIMRCDLCPHWLPCHLGSEIMLLQNQTSLNVRSTLFSSQFSASHNQGPSALLCLLYLYVPKGKSSLREDEFQFSRQQSVIKVASYLVPHRMETLSLYKDAKFQKLFGFDASEH